jgi:hypothetical protein
MRVAIKPHLVLHTHPTGNSAIYGTVTDGAVLRVVLGYIALALRGSRTMTLAESPIRITDFDAPVRWTRLDRVLEDVALTWGVDIELIDLRDQTVADPLGFHSSRSVSPSAQDPRGRVRVNLGSRSALDIGDSMQRCRRTAAVGRNKAYHPHESGRHLYELSNSILHRDSIISVPKFETHKQPAISGAMKNFVGAVARKEWLPRHRRGAPSAGRDDLLDDIDPNLKLREWATDRQLQSRFRRWIVDLGGWRYRHTVKGTVLDVAPVRHQSPMVDGGWFGNDTCWPLVHYCYRAVPDAEGMLRPDLRPRPLTIIDGVVAGDGDVATQTRPAKWRYCDTPIRGALDTR